MNASLTNLIVDAGQDRAKRDALLQSVYTELRQLAHRQLGARSSDQTLSTGPLVHEAYLKLFPDASARFQNRRHFFGAAARAMREIVIDYARARLAECRGCGQRGMNIDDLETGQLAIDDHAEHWLRVDAALNRLSEVDQRALQVAQLHYFAGMQIDDIAAALEISAPTVKRDTRFVREFLREALDA